MMRRLLVVCVMLAGCARQVNNVPPSPHIRVETTTACAALRDSTKECHWGDIHGCERRCACNDWDACGRLGFMYDPGTAHERAWPADSRRALDLYKLSCAGGSKSGCVELGNAYERGLLVKESADDARRAFAAACELKDAEACRRLGKLELREGRKRAIPALRNACRSHDAEACIILAQALLEFETPSASAEAATILEVACHQSRAELDDVLEERARAFNDKACRKLGELTGSPRLLPLP